jgi:DNA invertase Pin-like site-specific DNA recombinase
MNMDVDRIRSEVEQLQRTRRDIERLIQSKEQLILKVLPARHGFPDMDTFICMLARFASESLRSRIGDPVQKMARRSGKGKRYSAVVRVAVRKALEAHESVAEVAQAQGLSVGTVSRWKQKWGLSSPRRKRAVSKQKSKDSQNSGNAHDSAAD